jgi:MoxR-like ATPase
MNPQIRNDIISIISELNGEFFERETILKAAWAAVLSKQHMLLLGVPGTAKSAVTNAICKRIVGADYFEWLLTRFSTPEELFGPVSLKGLENDEYRRITTRKLPEAHIAFVDEIFKGNAAILNSLLTAINERVFDNDKQRLTIPLVSMFGASNELPQEEELAALYDRFILRFDVKYIQESRNWCSLIASATTTARKAGGPTTITMEDLALAQVDVAGVKFPEKIINIMRDIKMTLEREGVVASDRRWKQTVRVLQAWAWLDARDEVNEQDLELLCDMLWKEPEQRTTLISKVLSVTNPLDLEATKFFDDCLSVFSQFSPDCPSALREEIAAKLRAALEKIDSTLKIADPAKVKKMKGVRESVKGWYKQVVEALEL